LNWSDYGAPSDRKFETIAKKLLHYSGFDGQYINGVWRAGRSGRRLVDTDPYTGEPVASMGLADKSDVDEAFNPAAEAQPAWAALLPAQRAAVMLRCVDLMESSREEIIDWLISESGSTHVKAGVEWQMLHAITLEAASFPERVSGRILPIDEPGKESRAYRQPVGVIAVISPWNFPIYLSQRSIGPAIALGNTVVVKPAQDTPITGGLLIAKLFEEAGLPPGVLNVVVGASSDIGDAFASHPTPALISFTGSTAVGRHMMDLAATSPMLKRVALELGRLAKLHTEKLQHYIAAPVFGRPDAAAAGKLFIVTAGPTGHIERCRSLLAAMSQKVFVASEDPPAANLIKLSGNFLITTVIESLAEVFALARKCGVDSQKVLEVLTESMFSAPVYKAYGGIIASEKFEPVGFRLPLGLKDNRLILAAAEEAAVPMPMASLVHDRFVSAVAQGLENSDWSAMARAAYKDAGL
jgi:3-hydroxyisobutyrate dehydrogenase-like beta-hydroxyacid dehydrogenase